MVTRVKFHEKAVFIYALTQIDEGTSVIRALTGSVTLPARASSSATNYTIPKGTNTNFSTEVTKGCYIKRSNGDILGQVSAVTEDSIVLSAATVRNAPTVAVNNVTLFTTLGPNNVVAALNLNFSVDLTTEAFQYTGDELARDEVTVITDKIGKFDFESFMPISTFSSVDDIPYNDFFNACGFDTSVASGKAKLTNSTPKNSYLTIAIHRASQDDTLYDKVYQLSNVRGTLDADLTIGTKGKLKWNMQGNLDSIISEKKIEETSTEKEYLLDMKKHIASNINSDTIVTADIVNLSGYMHTFTASTTALNTTTIPAGSVITLQGGLVFTTGTGLTMRKLANNVFAHITAGATPTQLNLLVDDSFGVFTGSSFSDKYAVSIDTASTVADAGRPIIRFKPIAGSPGLAAFNFTWKDSAGASILSTWGSITASTGIAPTEGTNIKTICFDKLSLPNVTAYEYTRYKTGCLDGWSKGGTATDVTITILEDAAGAAFNPHNVLENNFALWFGYKSGNGSIDISLDKLQLTNVTSSKVATFMGQDLTLRNIGNTSIYITGLT